MSQTVLITGASRGIGAALVRSFVSRNTRVIAVARSWSGEESDGVIQVSADLSTDGGLATVARAVIDLGHPLDVLINNAGVQFETALEPDFSHSDIDTEVAVNLVGPIKLTQMILPRMRRPGGCIVNVTSLVALHPKPSALVYSATKAGLSSYTRGLRLRLIDDGVRVVEVFPPLVDTDMTLGRGHGKMSPDDMAEAIVRGVEQGKAVIAPGKSRLVRGMNRVFPELVARVLSKT